MVIVIKIRWLFFQQELLAANDSLKKHLDEKANEIALLRIQMATDKADFQAEREYQKEQLAAARRRIVELENNQSRLQTSLTTTTHQVSNNL